MLSATVLRVPKVSRSFIRKYHQSRCLLAWSQKDEGIEGYDMYFGRDGSPFKLPEVKLKGEKIRCLVIPGHTKIAKPDEVVLRPLRKPDNSRSAVIGETDDWTNVWQSAETFKWSVVPFPVRMGVVTGNMDNDGIVPEKYGNLELMKIPNFLHLTPAHVKKHCNAIKKFCTQWPSQLTDENMEKLFPVNIVTSEYVRDAPTHRDIRSRTVTLKVKLSALKLDYHARDKLLRLVKHRYNKKSNSLIFTSDKCPLKKQNYDYVCYLLAAVYHESWKTELWESDKTLTDMEAYIWELNISKKNIVDTVGRISNFDVSKGDKSFDDLRSAVEYLHNEGENEHGLSKYKNSVMKLLLNK